MSNLSLLSAVAAIGMTDPFSDSGIPSRRIYTLTGQTAQAWSRFLDRAAVGGDPYTTTERPGALEAARAFLDSIPVDRLSRARKATVAKLIRNLESPMSRRPNPAESVRILRAANPAKTSDTLATVRRYFPSATVSRTDSDGSRRSAYVGKLGPDRGEPGILEHGRRVWVEPGAASVRIRVYRFADPRRDRTLEAMVLAEERVVEPADLGAALAAVIAKHGGGARTGNPYGEPHTQETANIISHVIATLNNLERLAKKLNDTKTDEAAWDKLARKLIMLQISLRIPTEERIPQTMGYRERFDWFRRFAITSDMAQAEGRRPWWYGGPIPSGGARTGNPADGISISKLIQAYPAETAAIGFNAANPYAPAHTRALQRFADLLLSKLEAAYRKDGVVAFQAGSDIVHYSGFNPRSGDLDALVRETLQELAGGARTGNPPALIWEFDGEPTSPKALLADNPDNGDVAAAVAYLKKEGAKFSMGRHGTKSVRSWSAVSFGGGAADESVLTVRADWTDGPVFKAVLDASVIPYAGDLPDPDSPFSHRAGSDNWQDDFYSDFEEADDDG